MQPNSGEIPQMKAKTNYTLIQNISNNLNKKHGDFKNSYNILAQPSALHYGDQIRKLPQKASEPNRYPY